MAMLCHKSGWRYTKSSLASDLFCAARLHPIHFMGWFPARLWVLPILSIQCIVLFILIYYFSTVCFFVFLDCFFAPVGALCQNICSPDIFLSKNHILDWQP